MRGCGLFCVVLCRHQYLSERWAMLRFMGRKPRSSGAIHVVTNRRQGKHREYVTHLLRRSWREGGKVKNETVGNLSHLPEHVVELVRAALKGERFVAFDERFAAR